MLDVKNSFPDVSGFCFGMLTPHCLGLVLGIKVSDRSRKIPDHFSYTMVPTSRHITSKGPSYEGKNWFDEKKRTVSEY